MSNVTSAVVIACPLIAKFEGFRALPYRDATGVPTIGYGTTHGVTMNMAPITQTEALALLVRDATPAAQVAHDMTIPVLTDNQCAALCSFIYNLGEGNFAKSDLLKYINGGGTNGPTIRSLFESWDEAGGHVLAGLKTRRSAEADLYLK